MWNSGVCPSPVRPGVHVRPALDEPARHVDVVELECQVQERDARHGRRGIGVARLAFGFDGEDLAEREAAIQERRVAVEVLLEQVEPPAVQRHHRRVREREAGLADDLEARVLALGVPRIDADDHPERVGILGRRVQVGAVVDHPFQGPGANVSHGPRTTG